MGNRGAAATAEGCFALERGQTGLRFCRKLAGFISLNNRVFQSLVNSRIGFNSLFLLQKPRQPFLGLAKLGRQTGHGFLDGSPLGGQIGQAALQASHLAAQLFSGLPVLTQDGKSRRLGLNGGLHGGLCAFKHLPQPLRFVSGGLRG